MLSFLVAVLSAAGSSGTTTRTTAPAAPRSISALGSTSATRPTEETTEVSDDTDGLSEDDDDIVALGETAREELGQGGAPTRREVRQLGRIPKHKSAKGKGEKLYST